MSPLTHLHPAVVHFPIALLLLASAAGLLHQFAWPRAEVRIVTWTAMVLGWIACAVAVLTGLLAQAGLPPDAPYRSVLNWHIGAGLAVLAVYGLLLYLAWVDRSARAQKARVRRGEPAQRDYLSIPGRTRAVTAALLIAGALLVFLTGLNGGELVYLWGVNVAR